MRIVMWAVAFACFAYAIGTFWDLWRHRRRWPDPREEDWRRPAKPPWDEPDDLNPHEQRWRQEMIERERQEE